MCDLTDTVSGGNNKNDPDLQGVWGKDTRFNTSNNVSGTSVYEITNFEEDHEKSVNHSMSVLLNCTPN